MRWRHFLRMIDIEGGGLGVGQRVRHDVRRRLPTARRRRRRCPDERRRGRRARPTSRAKRDLGGTSRPIRTSRPAVARLPRSPMRALGRVDVRRARPSTRATPRAAAPPRRSCRATQKAVAARRPHSIVASSCFERGAQIAVGGGGGGRRRVGLQRDAHLRPARLGRVAVLGIAARARRPAGGSHASASVPAPTRATTLVRALPSVGGSPPSTVQPAVPAALATRSACVSSSAVVGSAAVPSAPPRPRRQRTASNPPKKASPAPVVSSESAATPVGGGGSATAAPAAEASAPPTSPSVTATSGALVSGGPARRGGRG